MKIAIYSGSRADYSIAYWVKKALNNYDDINSEIHRLIVNEDVMYIHNNIGKYDYIILIGDRKEVAEMAIEAVYYQIPIIHIGGGEVSEGSYDEIYRRMITQAARYHFVITDKCKGRLERMGICSKNIHVVGSPRIDYIHHYKLETINYEKPTALVIYHPETANEDTGQKAKIFYKALEEYEGLNYIVIHPNEDRGADAIKKEISHFIIRKRSGVEVHRELPLNEYLAILNSVDLMIGNSSAGIMETPTFKIPFVNVGDRQKGRDRLENTIDVECYINKIHAGISKALDKEFRELLEGMDNEFGDGHASERIAEIVKELV